MPNSRVAKLALEDGTIFTGTAFGAVAANAGEVVFNTSLSGYQEILTDPSYKGQIVTMTYPQIGNYGIADQADYESAKPQVEGFIIKELSPIDSNFRSVETLDAYLSRYNIPGIAGIDTRALVRKLRIQGALKGMTLIAGQKRGCKSRAKGLASNVTSNCSQAWRRNGVAMARSPRPQSSTTRSLGFSDFA